MAGERRAWQMTGALTMAQAALNGEIIHFDWRPATKQKGARQAGSGRPDAAGAPACPPASPPMVFANSLGTDLRLWDGLLDGFDWPGGTLRYDKRGHGLSSIGEHTFAIEDLAADLAALIDHVGCKPAIVCGLSIGGMIALSLAASRPDLVRALILMDTGHRIGTPQMWRQRIDQIEQGGIAAISDAVLARWFTDDFRTKRRLELEIWHNMLKRTTMSGYLGCASALREADLTAKAAALKVPTLCLVGDQDGATPPALVEQLAGIIDGADFQVIENAGHLPNIEQRDDVGQRIKSFIGRLSQAG